MIEHTVPYCGRFAPTPSGPLHFGSLVAAVASYIAARKAGGQWHVRIEDIDAPRATAGAAEDILRTLEVFGMFWDGPVVYQSQNLAAYEHALQQLLAREWVYPCRCTRREVADSSLSGIDGPIYPGICRGRAVLMSDNSALRLRVENRKIGFVDRMQGEVSQNLASEIGDFVLRRADGIFSYQLAVVVDDEALGVTEVVRGKDLIGSTVRQIYLQQLLGYATPAYLHIDVVCNEQGNKLSKQTLAPAVDTRMPVAQLCAAASFLGYAVETDSRYDSVTQFWSAMLELR